RVAWSLFDVHTNVDIDAALDASPQKVKIHMTRILPKTKTRNQLELALLLLDLDDEELSQPGLPPVTWRRRRRSAA
ncbi:MAG: hypothetical protein M3440_14915, partial [Chloroflexota bacterium]|nr:hypothetical protein [Chloroflexota bacterium]